MTWEDIKGFFATLTLKKLLPVVLILVLGILLVKLLLKLFDRALSRSKLDKTMFAFLRALMRVLLYALVLLIAAGSLDVAGGGFERRLSGDLAGGAERAG